MVPFEVGCARCGQSLRGQSDPRCPACGLDFDWEVALPLEHLRCGTCGYHLLGLKETRCPECGTDFTWDNVLSAFHRKRKPLFEYQWRKTPVRSLFRAWRSTFKPWRLWRTIELHDPPSIVGLFLLVILTALGVTVFIGVLAIAHNYVESRFLVPAMAQGVWWPGPGATMVPVTFGPAFFANPPWEVYLWYVPRMFGMLIPWGVGSLGALLLLRQSMSMCRVRNQHVVRIVAHALVAAMLGAAMLGFLWFAQILMTFILPVSFLRRTILVVEPLVILAAWGWTVVIVALGYRQYLRMPHAWSVALLTQLIALMLMPIAALVFQLLS